MNSLSDAQYVTTRTDPDMSSLDAQTQTIISRLQGGSIPRHIAIIMDGNGRWARHRQLPRSVGHYEGVASVRRVTELCSDIGVGFLTLYAFSTENWHRPQEEVDTLMTLIGMAIERETPDLLRNNVHLRLIGDLPRLPEDARRRLFSCRDRLENCTGLTLTLCLSYSSRWEITTAARQLAALAADKGIDAASINEDDISGALTTAGIPDPDLLIRTGGEKRLSNFLLWQAAYAELYFTDTLWPDFDKDNLADAIADFQHRERRFGKTSDQILDENSSADSPLPTN